VAARRAEAGLVQRGRVSRSRERTRAMDWEHREQVVPLGVVWTITARGHLSDPREEEAGRREVRARYDAIVAEHLTRAAAEGWEPEHPVDFEAVAAAGRLTVDTQFKRDSATFGFGELRTLTITHTYRQVTIRLRRRR